MRLMENKGLDMDDMERQVARIVREALLHEPAGLDRDTHLVKAGALDSLGVVAVAAALERRFGFALRDGDVSPRNFSTIAAIAALAAARAGGQPTNDEE
jgi:acyl carrier protein